MEETWIYRLKEALDHADKLIDVSIFMEVAPLGIALRLRKGDKNIYRVVGYTDISVASINPLIPEMNRAYKEIKNA